MAPSLFNRWPSAWNWLGQAYVARKDLDTALCRVREGIAAVPGDESLRHLEGSILHHLWPADPSLIPDAIRTNQFLLDIHPDEYGYVAELVSLRVTSGDNAAAWDVLVGWYERQDLGSGQALRHLGLELQDVRRALRFLPQYITFRGYRPIAAYLAATEESDATSSVAIDVPEVESVLYAGFAIAFGLAFDMMDRAERRRPRATALKAMRDSQRVVARTIPYAFAVLAESLGTGEASTEQRINLVAEGVTRAPIAGLLEMGALFGWLIALTLSEGDIDQVAARLDYSGMQGKLLEETLVQMNDVLGLLPRE